MNALVTYDIASHRTRTKVARILDDYGCRVQESVFELAELKEPVLKACLTRLKKKIILGKGDSIRIYLLCDNCRKRVILLGEGPKPLEVPSVYII
jgi:CRISPR-associated protein Cas2